jgi:predicted CoA-binding protein
MVTKTMIDDFISQPSLAIVGISRKGGNKFGNSAFKELKTKGYQLFIVHPSGEVIEGQQSYQSLKDLPQKVGGVLVVVPPAQAEIVVKEAHEAGINRVWLQQGAESQVAIQYCQQNGMNVVCGQCILMHAKPIAFFHKPHRWVMQLLGQLPK